MRFISISKMKVSLDVADVVIAEGLRAHQQVGWDRETRALSRKHRKLLEEGRARRRQPDQGWTSQQSTLQRYLRRMRL